MKMLDKYQKRKLIVSGYSLLKGIIIVGLSLVSSVFCGCTGKNSLFDKEELVGYGTLIIFLETKETGEQYFISLDSQEKNYLDYTSIEDYNSEKQKFLFFKEKDDKKELYEYDLKKKTENFLLDDIQICQYLNEKQREKFEKAYYYEETEGISFQYGNNIFLFDSKKDKLSDLEVSLEPEDKVYGWLDKENVLCGNYKEVYEFNVESGEKRNIKSDLGSGIILSSNKEKGCSYGNENYFGADFMPILIWNTSDYQVKRMREGILSSARMQISPDGKYIMFVRWGENQKDNEYSQLLCIREMDENVFQLYQTEDIILDILWE